MLSTASIKNIYSNIQKQLYYMIPEKWEKVCLYASVMDHFNNVQTGEMYFYYYPKSVLKKNPINVYEVPNKFNIDENGYIKLTEKLYAEIKRLRKEQIKLGEKPWSNVTITIENYKFTVEYDYDNLMQSEFSSDDRHIIWRYKNLNIPIQTYTKKEQNMIRRYFAKHTSINKNENTYTEGIYKNLTKNLLEFKELEERAQEQNRHNFSKVLKEDTKEENNENIKKNQILNI